MRARISHRDRLAQVSSPRSWQWCQTTGVERVDHGSNSRRTAGQVDFLSVVHWRLLCWQYPPFVPRTTRAEIEFESAWPVLTRHQISASSHCITALVPTWKGGIAPSWPRSHIRLVPTPRLLCWSDWRSITAYFLLLGSSWTAQIFSMWLSWQLWASSAECGPWKSSRGAMPATKGAHAKPSPESMWRTPMHAVSSHQLLHS